MAMEENHLPSILHSIQTGKFSVPSFQATLFGLLKNRKGKHIIQALLQAEAGISTQTSPSSDPEQIDIRSTHRNIVQLLVNSAENRDFYDDRKQTVLHHASKHGWLEIVTSLLKKGADPNVKDRKGRTPLFSAMQKSYTFIKLHDKVVEMLIESGADVFCHSNVNYTLLHVASKKGWLEFVQFLLNKGVDPNIETNDGFTPLDFAIKAPNKEMIPLLIDSGANIKRCKLSKGAMLYSAARRGHLQVLQFLLKKVGPKSVPTVSSLLFSACKCEQIETIEFLMKLLNRENGRDDTPLTFIIARYRNNSKLVKLFIERGAYLDFSCYDMVLKNQSLKEAILQNVHICCQCIINKFNHKDLPDLFKLPMPVGKLAPLKNLMIKSPGVIGIIEESVRNEIETNGHCDLMKPRALRMMSVQSYIDYYEGPGKKSELKRSATSASDDQSQSKIQCLH